MFRSLVRKLHFYCGITLGVFFAAISLSGAILVFYIDIDRFINSEIHDVMRYEPRVQQVDWDKAVSTLRNTFPKKLGPWRLEVAGDGRAIPVRYYNPSETKGKGFAPMMVWLSSDASEVVRTEFWGSYLMTWVYTFHYQLLMGERGAIVVGCLGIILVLLFISGLLTWWPRKGGWVKSLRVKRRAALTRQLYDWHKIIGLIVLIPALLLSVTGAMLALPEQAKSILEPMFGVVKGPTFTAHDTNPLYGASALPLSLIVAKAKHRFHTAELAWVEIPPVEGGFYRLRFQVDGDPSRRFPHSYIELDAHSGEITHIFDVREQPFSNTIKNWLHPLHNASAFGVGGKILWVLIGVALFFLWGIGFARWCLRSGRLLH